MHRGQDDLDALVFADGRAGHLELSEDSLRKSQLFDEVKVPVLLRRVEKRSRRRVGVFVDDVTSQSIVEVFRNGEETRRLL